MSITLEEHHKNLELFQLVYYQFYLKASLSSLLTLVQPKSTTLKTWELLEKWLNRFSYLGDEKVFFE